MLALLKNKYACCSICLLLVTFTSCVKDRVGEGALVTPGAPADPGNRTLIHFWDFNSGKLTDPAFTIGGGVIETQDTYDDTEGSDLNLRENSKAGDALRVRNPSSFMVLRIPTTGYRSPLLTFVVMRTNNGPKENIIEYTINGTDFISSGIVSNKVTVGTEWTVYAMDFAGIPGVDNNPLFAVRFTFSVGNANNSGNDRYDNISVDALP